MVVVPAILLARGRISISLLSSLSDSVMGAEALELGDRIAGQSGDKEEDVLGVWTVEYVLVGAVE